MPQLFVREGCKKQRHLNFLGCSSDGRKMQSLCAPALDPSPAPDPDPAPSPCRLRQGQEDARRRPEGARRRAGEARKKPDDAQRLEIGLQELYKLIEFPANGGRSCLPPGRERTDRHDFQRLCLTPWAQPCETQRPCLISPERGVHSPVLR